MRELSPSSLTRRRTSLLSSVFGCRSPSNAGRRRAACLLNGDSIDDGIVHEWLRLGRRHRPTETSSFSPGDGVQQQDNLLLMLEKNQHPRCDKSQHRRKLLLKAVGRAGRLHRRDCCDPRRPVSKAEASCPRQRRREILRRQHGFGLLLILPVILLCGIRGEISVVGAAGVTGCSHLQEWTGQWYQSGIAHAIRISAHSLGHKGQCVAEDVRGRVMKKFLLHNQEENCFRCVVIHQRHRNVLQYKESPCRKTRSSLRSLCQGITGDSELYSLFRMNSSAATCPVQGHFSFSYNRGHGWCQEPVSTVKTCIGDSSMLFHYQACPDIPGTESFQEELQCVGEWKEGTTKYLVVRAVEGRMKPGSDKFKCLVYNVARSGGSGLGNGAGGTGNVIDGDDPSSMAMMARRGAFFDGAGHPADSMASSSMGSSSSSSSMSSGSPSSASGMGGENGGLDGSLMDVPVDVEMSISDGATCNGLISASEGAQTLRLVRDGAPTPRCTLPSWFLRHRQWHTLDNSVVYHVRPSNDTLDVVTRHGGFHQELCHHLVPSTVRADVDSHIDVVSHVTQDCDAGYVCSRIWRRDGDVIQVVQGASMEHPSDACSHMHDYPSSATSVILIPSELPHRPCPWRGMYHILLNPTTSFHRQQHQQRHHYPPTPSSGRGFVATAIHGGGADRRRGFPDDDDDDEFGLIRSNGGVLFTQQPTNRKYSPSSSPWTSSSTTNDCGRQRDGAAVSNSRLLKMACSEAHAMEMEHSTEGCRPSSEPTTFLDKYVCHAAWEESNTHRIVASRYTGGGRSNSTSTDSKVCFVTTRDSFGSVETVFVGTTCFPLENVKQYSSRQQQQQQQSMQTAPYWTPSSFDGNTAGAMVGARGSGVLYDGGRVPILAAAATDEAFLRFDVTYGGDCSSSATRLVGESSIASWTALPTLSAAVIVVTLLTTGLSTRTLQSLNGQEWL